MKRLAFILVLTCSLAARATATDDARYKNLGNKIQCSCGCNQMLLQCNHVGCQSSRGMILDLRAAVAKYKNDEDVLNWFRQNYGVTTVVVPATHGFELISWVVPPVLVAVAVLLLVLLIRHWRQRAVAVAGAGVDPRLDEFRARARKETEL